MREYYKKIDRKLKGYVICGKFYDAKKFSNYNEFLLFLNRKPCEGYKIIYGVETSNGKHLVGETRPNVIHTLLDDAFIDTATIKGLAHFYKLIGLEQPKEN